MNPDQIDFGRLALTLSGQNWSWTKQNVGSVLKLLGFSKSENVGHRETYISPDRFLADVYCNGDHVECVESTLLAFET